jgi:hypothetical protein
MALSLNAFTVHQLKTPQPSSLCFILTSNMLSLFSKCQLIVRFICPSRHIMISA